MFETATLWRPSAPILRESLGQVFLEELDADAADEFEHYQFAPRDYIVDKLGWEPWQGSVGQPGQQEIIDAYTLALRQQHERLTWESGEIATDDLIHWQPGQTIQNRLRIEAGHTVGKTKLAAGLVNHFFDCFVPSIIYSFAPSWDQIHDLLWKEIKADRLGKHLPGRVLDLELKRSPEHFAKGRATDNANNRGTERVQGQHGQYLMFVIDEAEGVADYVFDAINSMASGGIVVVLMLANPKTRASRFYKLRERSDVANFRISCIWHPNVLAGREVVPNAVRRDYVETMMEEHCEVVPAHNSDQHTFDVPWRPGRIYKPDAEFMFRVLGEAPANMADNTLIPFGRYEAAAKRASPGQLPHIARIGVDVARFGHDYGTIYVRHNGVVHRSHRLYHLDTYDYAQAIIGEAERLRDAGVTSLHVRIDAGGGYGGGVIDQLARNLDLLRMFEDFQVIEVHFNGVPHDAMAYADQVTEMYADAAEALKALAVHQPPSELEADLCERTYRWMTKLGVAVKKLEPKDDFKKRILRSPDDGDGFILAVASDYLFYPKGNEILVYDDPVQIGPQF